jgi:prepilin-type N-terminal cleavage/methylation domain-containing protein
MITAVKMLLTHRQSSFVRRRKEVGMTLVEILVVIAIIAALAAIIYPAIMDSLKKSQAAMIAQRLDAVQKAKVQYAIDLQTNASPVPLDTAPVLFENLKPYLTRFGMQLKGEPDLSQGTGGTINLGVWGSNPYFQGGAGASSNQYISAYNIPTSPSPPSGTGN